MPKDGYAPAIGGNGVGSGAGCTLRLATRAEELGFDSVWVHDHVFNVGLVLMISRSVSIYCWL